MRSSRRTEGSLNSSAQQPINQDNGRELTAAWKSLAQSKAALRHIENRLEATPGTGVLLDSVMDPRKTSSGSTRKVSRRDGGRADEVGGSSKWRGRGHQSPEKSSSRSPLRNTTQDCNVRRNTTVEFREPLASYREATPPLTTSQLEAHSLQLVPGVSYSSSQPTSDPTLSQLVYQRDTRDRQTDRDLDSTHSSALGSTEVRYLNDRPALDALRTTPQPRPVGGRAPAGGGAGEEGGPKAQLPHGRDSQAVIPSFTPATDPVDPAENSASTSPGSASQRLENLRRRQPDDKLEKLKERIRRQREHLEEAAERDRLLGYLEQPILGAATLPTATIRKVAPAPPAPIYRGFNSSEMKIRTPDGKVWKEEEFHNLSREIYRDLSRQLTESTRPRQQQRDQRAAERSRERRPPKPVRKVHKATPASDPDAKPVIRPSSWREGQKLIKMVLGPAPRLPREDEMHPADRLNKTGAIHRSRSDPRSESNQCSRPEGTERPRSRGRSNSHSAATAPSPAAAQALAAPSTDLLSADIQGILDDLQLECKRAEREEERARQRSRGGDSSRRGRGGSGSRTRAPVSAWGGGSTAAGGSLRGSRSTSPVKRQPEPGTTADTGQKKRHYDADSVRQYITRQQEERKKRQVEERKAQREEVEKRNQRLQELYRRQRGGGGGGVAKSVVLSLESPVGPVQKRLQETYTKLLLEEAQLGEEATQTQPATMPPAATFQLQPMYQPSGESDKENKRLEAPQSPSSSDMSLSEQPPPLSRNDLGVGVPSWLQPDHFLSPAVRPATMTTSTLAPPGDHLLSQLLRLDTGSAAGGHRHTQHSTTPPSNRARSNISRIEALKATAASLSNRIESEARKLAGEGINYGSPTTMDVDAILAPQPSQTNHDDGRWAKAVSPPVRETTAIAMMDNDDLALRIKRILSSAGQSSYDSAALPGVGNVHATRGQKERNATQSSLARPQNISAPVTGHNLGSHVQEGRKLVNGLERVERMKGLEQRRGYERGVDGKTTDLHDSSGGSISEGPLLSEGSLSDGEASPPHRSTNHIPRPADRLGALDYCAGQRVSYQPLSQFQKEAEKYSALSSPFSQRDGNKAAWEELSKGSPLSVINIFTKNLQSHPKAADERPERSSPSIRSVQSRASPADAAAYEDDFVSSRSSGGSGQSKKGYNGRSANIHYEELMRRSPYENRTGDYHSHHSSTSGSSPLSKGSTGKKGAASDQSDCTLLEEQRSSEALSTDSRRKGSERSSAHSQAKGPYSDGTLGGASGHSIRSLGLDSKRSPVGSPGLASPAGSPPGPGSPPGTDYPGMSAGSASLPGADGLNIGLGLGSGSSATAKGKPTAAHTTTAASSRVETRTAAELQFTPGVLQQRMSAELNYLESIEESVRQLGDVERLRGVSMAQQESVSLAQILKAQQQRHERDLYELKIKAEREALETQLHLEEGRQRAARAHAELQGSMAASQQKSLGGLQEATAKMMSQQAEAARYTADAARHIKEMTELAQSQIAGALSVPVAPMTSLLDQQSQHHNSLMKRLQATADTDRSEVSGSRTRTEDPLSPLDSFSHSDSLPSRRPNLSGGESSSHLSPSHTSSDQRERRREKEGVGSSSVEERREKEGVGSSSVEEDVQTAADDSPRSASIPSMLDEKADSTSVATEYSLKFDESMTEDEIEERSFRSLLPSEAHRRGTLERKPRPQEESEEEAANHDRTSGSAALTSFKPLEASMAFSGGQDSFSQFTMDMVRQYMKDEEVRLQHQSSLLHLRQKALKEKTRTELAWLEHQRRRLRDKGEDDKMPPIRKKQRGLLMKLQQEQAEIKRLQDANKAARKERQLLLKQQEEIERMRNSTLRLKERLKCAGGEALPETPNSETPVSEAAAPDTRVADGDVRTPSPPLSISGSETSSIMQKLKKMRSHMDEKFLTKREQQLMQRRRHAEELLEWKQRLDQEEAEVCRMEKEALAVWDRQTPRDRDRKASERWGKESSDVSSPDSSHHRSPEHRTDSEKECVSEGESSVHTDLSASQAPACPSTAPSASVPESLPASAQHSPANYASDFTSASPSPSKRSPAKGSLSTVPSQAEGGGSSKMQLLSPSRTPSQTQTQTRTQSTDTPTASQTEPTSDQSDIESRIGALKEELRKRKSMAYQLKKEQKKRHKERLKAQEASLLKQLDSYNDFIQKTKAELNKEPELTPAAKPQIKAPTSASEKPKIKPPPPHRAETSKSFNMVSDAERTRPDSPVDQDDLTSPGRSRSTSLPEELSDEDPPTVTPTPVYGSPEHPTSDLRSLLSPECLSRPVFKEAHSPSIQAQPQVFESGANCIVSSYRSEVVDELEVEVGNRSEDHPSDGLLKLDLEEKPNSQQKPAEEVVKCHSSKPYSASVESKGPQYPDYCYSSDDHSYTPDSIAFSKTLLKDVEASPRSADGYHDDFESSLESSLREDHQSFKATSPTSPAHPETRRSREGSRSRSPLYDSQDEEEVEEDIAAELSEHSGTNGDSHHSGRLLDLHRDDTMEKNAINSNHSPTISPSQTPPSQARDEMPGFSVGDRVLVSSVQPGILRFKGPTRFANGFWAGVELDKSEGSNNGTYDGVRYFECEECHGIFAPPDKITRLPEKFEIYVDTTEDEDSFFGDMSETDRNKGETDRKKPKQQGDLKRQNEETSHRVNWSSGKDSADGTDCPDGHQNSLTTQKENSFLNSQNHKESAHPMANGRDIILEFEDRPTTLLISDMDRIDLGRQSLKEITTLIDKKDIESHHKSITPPDVSTDTQDVKSPMGKQTDRESLGVFADKLLNNFVKDAVKQLTQIKKAKEQKIVAANQMKAYFLSENVEEEEGVSSVGQKDGLPFFLDTDKEELSSPELCNRPVSPVLGASGQEELAKRLAELELSRELLDELGDEQDWFDEDFGLSSRREQQRLKQREEEEEILGGGRSGLLAPAALGGEQQAKTPPRPELPLPLPPKLPEQPAMVVPHSAVEVERLVHTATQEIWDACKLGKDGTLTLAGKPSPKPSEEYLGKEAKGRDQEALCIRSYRQAVYDLTWEILQEIYGEDPSVCQPLWVKPRRASSSYFHRVKTPGDITKVQEFITSEVLKLYGLKKDHNQKTDWQKMLKFGRKKRDRVDHILVQELHEEEAQWVNYDEDELFVKMQLADSIFEALLKDTADVLTQIHDKRAKRAALS